MALVLSASFVLSGMAYALPVQADSNVISSFDDQSTYTVSGYSDIRHIEADGDVYLSMRTVPRGSGDAVNIVSKVLTPAIDMSGTEPDDLYLSFDMYIEDIDSVSSDCQIELTSSGRPDVEEIGYSLTSVYRAAKEGENGFRHIVLNLGQGSQSPGSRFQVNNINFFRIYIFTDRVMEVRLNNMKLTRITKDFFEEFDAADSSDRWESETTALSVAQGALRAEITGETEIRTDDYCVATLTPEQDTLAIRYTAEDPDKITEMALLIGDGRSYATYLLDPSAGEREVYLSDYDRKDAGLTDLSAATEAVLRIKTTARTTVEIDYIGILSGAQNLDLKIRRIGELTLENYKEKLPLIEQALALRTKYLADNSIPLAYDSIVSYALLEELLARVEIFEKAEQEGVYLEIVLPDEEPQIGDTVTLKANIRNLTQQSMTGLSLDVQCDSLALEMLSESRTEFFIQPGQTKTIDLIFRVSEGGQSVLHTTIYKNDVHTVAEQTIYFTVKGQGWYAGDSHNHSIESDGADSLVQNIIAAYKNGALVHYTADHNADPGDTEGFDIVLAALALAGYGDMVAVKGDEITSYVTGSGHLLQYGSTTFYSAPSSTNLAANSQAFQEIMTAIMQEGGYTYLAHPYASDWPFYGVSDSTKNVNVYQDFTGVEIYNYVQNDSKYEKSLLAIEFWDRMNLKGEKKYFGIGNSDSHNTGLMNISQTVFLLDELSREAYINALGRGSFYATTGSHLRFQIGETDMGGSVIVEKQETQTFTIKAVDFEQPLTQVNLIKYTINEDNDAGYSSRVVTALFSDPAGAQNCHLFEKEWELTVKPGEFYRIEAVSLKVNGMNRVSCSNPIWITTAATTLDIAEEQLTMRPGEQYMLNITTDNIYDSVILSVSDPSKAEVRDNGYVAIKEGATGKITVTAMSTGGTAYDRVEIDLGDETASVEQLSVNIELQGGTAAFALQYTLEPGTCFTKPTVDPTREGYVFLGWFDSAEGGMPIDFTESLTQDLTLYAQWKKSEDTSLPEDTTYTVTLDLMEGHSNYPTSFRVKAGETLIALDAPTRSGYTFVGFYTAPEGGEQFDFSSPVTENITIYARWEATTKAGCKGALGGMSLLAVLTTGIASAFSRRKRKDK